jgi:hypothetical protein
VSFIYSVLATIESPIQFGSSPNGELPNCIGDSIVANDPSNFFDRVYTIAIATSNDLDSTPIIRITSHVCQLPWHYPKRSIRIHFILRVICKIIIYFDHHNDYRYKCSCKDDEICPIGQFGHESLSNCIGMHEVLRSRIILNNCSYGSPEWKKWVLDEGHSKPFIKRALDLGINFFDTANVYSVGQSEVVSRKNLISIDNR